MMKELPLKMERDIRDIVIYLFMISDTTNLVVSYLLRTQGRIGDQGQVII